MKPRISFLFVLATGLVVADPSDYVNFVRQIQGDSYVEWDVSVAPSGQMLSPEGVGPDGSLFQLWSIHRLTFTEFLLDEKFVSTYSPGATITILTGDPYKAVPRTRVDQPFTVNIEVDGLVTPAAGDTSVPIAAQKVFVAQETYNYPAGQHSLEGISDPSALEVATAFLDRNGEHVLNFAGTSLTGPDLTSEEGEEVFTISALEDVGVSASVIDQKRIQIWPIAQGGITGIDPNERYSDLPPITVLLRDLYPDSTTYVRFYHGPPKAAPPEATTVASSYVIVKDSIPQDRSIVLKKIDDLFVKEGAHTLEVIHETPFGVDLIAQYYPLQVDRTVEFRGGLFTNE